MAGIIAYRCTMVRNYKRKTARQSWSDESMRLAIEMWNSGDIGYRQVAQQFDVPWSTLRDRIKENNKVITGANKGFAGGFRTVFSEENEGELCAYILRMEEVLLGLSRDDVRHVAYQFAVRNNIPNNFNQQSQMAGYDWLMSFRHRHPEISLRTPEATSAARARGFNRVNVDAFYALYGTLLDAHTFEPGNIYNVDETGITTVQGKPSKVLGRCGKKQIGCLTSAERGTLVTAVIAMNAAGNYVPPMLIFPRVRRKPEMMNGAPPGSIFACHPSGWMQTDLFTDWFRHFIAFAKPANNKPVLLVLDGHATHTKNIDVIDLARQHNVHIICLPPHCTHRLQPLDVAFMKPLSSYYDEAVRIWLRSHPGRVVTIHQIAALFGGAYLKAAAAITAVNGFRKTGIVPFNPAIFNDADFAGSNPTEIACETNVAVACDTTVPRQDETPLPRPSGSHEASMVPTSPAAATSQHRLVEHVSPSDILPIPHVAGFQARGRKRSNQCGKTAVLTASPYKLMLEMGATNRPAKSAKIVAVKKPGVKKNLKKSCFSDAASNSDTDVPTSDPDDSSDEALVELTRKSAINTGDFVLVKFAKKQRVTYYAGKVMRVDRRDGEVRTSFLKRNDMRKSGAITFGWPETKDLAWHDEQDVVDKLPEATPIGDTTRTADKLGFQFDFTCFESMLL